jgi:hypothetical protein
MTDLGTFQLYGTPSPEELAIAMQSAQERADALGVPVRVVGADGMVVDVVKPRQERSHG